MFVFLVGLDGRRRVSWHMPFDHKAAVFYAILHFPTD